MPMNETVYLQANRQSRKLYFDVMRIVAVLFVIFNHTDGDGFLLFQRYPFDSFEYWLSLSCTVFCKFAVPLFFAISGALMLGKRSESFAQLWKRLTKYAVILVVFSGVYAVENHILDGVAFSAKDFISLVWSKSAIGYHLRYLYAYIAYLIGLPILRVLAQNMEKKHYRYLMIVAIVFNTIPLIEYILWRQSFTMNADLKPGWMLSNVVLYPLMGYYLEYCCDNEISTKENIALCLGALLCIIVCDVVSTLSAYTTGRNSWVICENYSFVCAAVVFLLIKMAVQDIRIPKRIQNVLVALGRGSFGIYLFHLLVIRVPISEKLRQILLTSGIHPMIAIWIFIFYVFFVSYLLTAILLKAPLLKKLVGG